MSKSIIERLSDIDPKVIYAVLFVVGTVPLLNPLGLPIGITNYVKDIYDAVEALPPGSVVTMSVSYGPAGDPTYGQGFRAMTQHVMNRPLRLIFISLTVQGPLSVEDTLNRINIPPDKEYGVDYVDFGYIAGVEAALSAIASDVHTALPKDFYGTPIEDIPMMNDIRTGADIAFIMTYTGDAANMEAHLRQFKGPYGILVASACEAVSLPYRAAYYPDQVVGIISDMKGGSEYEQLVYGHVLKSATGDAQSLVHLTIIIFIAIGNFAYVSDRIKRGK